MSKILYIQGSPRTERSRSRGVADAFLSAYLAAHDEAVVETLDVFRADLPPLDGLAIEAKYRILHGQEAEADERKAWAAVERVIEQFTSADMYVLAVPMWNFGIPYRLKHYLDLIVQPGITFAYDPETGYSGLVTGKRAFVAYARGGDYSPGSGVEALDHQKSYLELILGFVGITDVRSIVVQPTLMGGSEVAERKEDEAIAQAEALAIDF